MSRSETLVIGAVLVLAGIIFLLQRRRLEETVGANAGVQSAIEQAEREIEAARKAIARAEARSVNDRSVSGRSPRGETGASNAPDIALTQQAHPSQNASAGYVSLTKTNLHHLELKPFNDEFHLTDEAVAILGMSDSEQTAVNGALGHLLARHSLLDLSLARQIDEHLTDEAGVKTTFKVEAYPEQGKALAREFLDATQKAIGSNRTDLLLGFADLNSLSADGFEPFGATEKTITFLDQTDENGQRRACRILMKVNDARTGFTLSTGFANDDDHIPVNWRHLIQNIHPGK